MKAHAAARLPLCAAVATLAMSTATPSWALFDFFKKQEKQAPSTTEKQAQEAAASSMLSEARAAQSAGNASKADALYESIVKKYPFTDSAGEAAYARALMMRQNGKLQDAFDGLQEFIANYRQSPRFSDAIQAQFEIAEEAKGGKKQKTMLMVPMKVNTDDLVGLYKTIIQNAPFGKYAPMAQFSIAEIYQDKGEKDQAIGAYQAVVDNYPSSSQAAEAQFRIGAISNVAAKRSEDSGNLTTTRDALTTYMATNPSGERASEAEVILSQVNSAEAAKSLEVGKFYERMGKPKAAAIYYNEALKYGSAESSEEARKLLSALAQSSPEAVSDTKMQPAQDYTVPAAVDLRSRDDYVGPPSPELAKLSQKPKMRTEQDSFMPIPLQEPALPTRPGASSSPQPGMILPPADADKPLLLPVPPAPGIPPQPAAAPPVPPAPTPAAPDAKPAEAPTGGEAKK